MSENVSGYVHGSDLLVGFMSGETFKALGHSKTCTISNKSETKVRAHKETTNSGKWDAKTVSKQSVSITAEGFVCYEDAENGYPKLLELWEAGEAITVRYAYRGEEASAYHEGQFVIASLEQVGPSDEDATYTLTLENSGSVTKKTASTPV